MIVALLDNRLALKWASKTVFPLTLEDVIGKAALSFISPNDQPEVRARLLRCKRTNEPQAYFVTARVKRQKITFFVRAQRVPSGILCVSHEVPHFARKVREQDFALLRMLAFGIPVKEIAHALELTVSAVHKRRKRLQERIGAHTREELLQIAIALTE